MAEFAAGPVEIDGNVVCITGYGGVKASAAVDMPVWFNALWRCQEYTLEYALFQFEKACCGSRRVTCTDLKTGEYFTVRVNRDTIAKLQTFVAANYAH